MAKAPAKDVQDTVMEAGRLRSMLKIIVSGDEESPKSRLPVVVALDNADEGVIVLARRGSPKKLRTDLIKTVQKEGLSAQIKAEPARLSIGYAYATDEDPTVLQIDVSKPPPSVAKLGAKILRRVRNAGFGEVVFHVNESIENESEQDGETAGAPSQTPPQAPPPAPPPAQAAPNAAPDLAAVQSRLVTVIGSIARMTDPARKATMAKIAAAANAAIKAQNAGEAERLVQGLMAALARDLQAAQPPPTAQPPAGGPAPGAGPNAAVQPSATAEPAPTAGPTSAAGPTPAPDSTSAPDSTTAADTTTAAESSPAADQSAKSPDEYLVLFRDAKDEVDAGLTKLQQVLRSKGDADLERIADYGLFGMTDGQGVGLMKALFDLRAAGPDKRAEMLQGARAAAAAYKSAVFSDAAVDLVDRNPFGIEVGIRAKLGQALDAIANAV